MRVTKRILAAAVALAMAAQGAAANTFFYYRGGAQPQSWQQTGSKPASPAPAGTFAILIDADQVAVRGNSYSGTVYAYSNSGTVAFSVVSGALPAGISLSGATGTLSGIPTAVQSTTAVIQGRDTATGATATATLTLDSVDPFSISGSPASVVQVGQPYSAAFTLAGGAQPYAMSSYGLPSGIDMTQGATGATLSGSAQTAGSFAVSVTGVDKHGLTATYPYTLQVADPLAVAGLPPSIGTVGTAYSGQVTVSGGASPFTFSVAAGTLPSGITLKSGTGVISGTPSSAGVKAGIKIKVTDASGQSATSAAFTITIAASGTQALTISGAPPTTATEGQAYFAQFSAGGGTAPYVYSVSSGALPAGLSFNPSTGLITGSPTGGSAGVYPGIVISVTDANSRVASTAPFSITLSTASPTLAIAGSPKTSAQAAIPYAVQFSASGGSGAGYVFSSAGSALPPGLSIDPTSGVLSGSPTAVGTYSGLKIKVVDSAAHSATTAAFSIQVTPAAPLTIAGNPSPSAVQGNAYSATWTGFDGSGAGYHFTSVGSALPPGLTLTDINGAQGLLSGTATVAGTYSGLQIKVVDSAGGSALSPVFTITVTAPPPPPPPQDTLAVLGAPASGAVVGKPYSAQFSASGGAGGYVFSAVGGLPGGLSLDPTSGLLSGTPTAAGTFGGLAVKVVDASAASAESASFSITVSSALAVSGSPPGAIVGQPYSAQFTASGGTGGYRYSVNAALPDGLGIDASTGLISGVPTTPGTVAGLRVIATDSSSATGQSAPFAIAVTSALAITGTPPTTASLGVGYDHLVAASGGTASGYAFVIASGSLPPGLALDPTSGRIWGTPSATGAFGPLVVKVTDSSSTSASSQPFTITVGDASPLAVNWLPQTSYAIGATVSITPSASGGDPAHYAFGHTGTLPPGVTQNATTGTLGGQPTAVGSYGPIAITLTDGLRGAATSAVTITVSYPGLSISGAPQTAATAGTAYAAKFTAGGGTGSGYVYAISTGTLPPGLSLDTASGQISGTVALNAAGSYGPISVSVTDGVNGNVAAAPFTVVVSPPTPPQALALSGSAGPATVGIGYSAQFSGSGGFPGYSYTLTGSLPPGLSFDGATGTVAGTPTAAGTYAGLVIGVTDGSGAQASSQPFAITVGTVTPLTISWNPQTTWSAGDFMALSVDVAGGNPANYTFSMAGTPPHGTTFQPSNGAIVGALDQAGTFGPVTITVSDGTRTATTTPATFKVSPFQPLSILWVQYPTGPVNVGDWLYAKPSVSGGDQSRLAFSYSGTLPPNAGFTSWDGSVCCSSANGGSFTFSVTVSDGTFTATTDPLTIVVNPPLALAVGYDQPIRTGTVGSNYYEGFWGINGARTGYQCAVASASAPLPPGLSRNGCSIQGVPTTAGSYPGILLQVTDYNGSVAVSDPITITVNETTPLAIVWNNPPSVVHVGEFVNIVTTASGGYASRYAFSLNGTKPPGINFTSDGHLCCGISQTGTYPLSVTVSDGTASATTAQIDLVVRDMELAATFPGGMAGSWYHASLQPLGGDGGNTFSCTGLPTGLTIAPWGSIDGPLAADAAGTYTPNCTTTDRSGRTASVAATFRVASTPPTISAVWVEGVVGTPFSYTPTTSGGLAPYTITAGGDPLPPGLSIDPATGRISGTPTAKGQANIVLYLTDAGGFQANTGHILIDIYQDGVISFPNKFTYDEMVNRAPWSSFDGQNGLFGGTSTGGSGGEGWAITNISAADAIKLGFSWAQEGQRIGFNGNFPAPTTAGTYEFDLVVRDNAHNQGHRHYSLTVWPEIKLDPAPPPNAVTNQAYSWQMTVTGGKQPLHCSGGTPAGLSVDPTTCVISGMTTSADSNFNRNFIAQDASGYYASVIWRLQSVPPPTTQDPGGNPPPANNVGHDATDWHPYVQTIDLRKLALTGQPYYPSVPSAAQAAALNAAFDAKDVAVCVNQAGVHYGAGWSSDPFACDAGGVYQQPTGLTYAVDPNAGTLTIYGTPYDNVLPVSCGNGCQKFDVGYKDYVIPIFISTGSAGAISASATLRVWAWAPPPSNTSGLTASYTSTSTDPSCGGACDVSAVIRQGGNSSGTVAGRDFVNLAVGDSITIQYRTLVQAFNVGLQMSCNMTLDTSGTATYRLDAWDGYSTDGSGQPVWQPFEYQWWGADRILPGPDHVPFSKQTCVDALSFNMPGPIDYATTQYPYDPNFPFGPWDHTTDYLTQGRPVLALKLTRTGGTMPFWPVSSFFATGQIFLAAAP